MVHPEDAPSHRHFPTIRLAHEQFFSPSAERGSFPQSGSSLTVPFAGQQPPNVGNKITGFAHALYAILAQNDCHSEDFTIFAIKTTENQSGRPIVTNHVKSSSQLCLNQY